MNRADLSEREATYILRSFEQRYDMLQFQIDGLSYWMALRFPIYKQLMASAIQPRSRPKRTMWGAVISDISKYWLPRRAAILVRTSSSFFEPSGDKYSDRFFDDLIPVQRVFKVEAINSIAHYLDHQGNTRVPVDLTTEYISLQARILGALIVPKRIRQISKAIEEAVSSGLPQVSLPSGWVQSQLVRFHWRRKLFARLLKQIGAQLVFTSSTDDYPLFAAARDVGIPCCEFQHGLFSADHPDVLWEYMSAYRKHLVAPSKLFLFGEFWKRELLSTGFYMEEELVPVGSARIDFYRKMKEAARQDIKGGRPLELLVTTQGVAQLELVEFLESFCAICERHRVDFTLTLKTHPREVSFHAYEKLLQNHPRITLIPSNSPPSTYELMTRTDFHLSIFSTSHFEALGLGVPTIVLGLPGHTTVASLYEEGDAKLAKTPEELFEIVRQGPKPVTPDKSQKYYSTNPAGTIAYYIRSVT